MNPRVAIVFFLMAAGITVAIILPARSRAERTSFDGPDCTLGSCSRNLSSAANGGKFIYYTGDVLNAASSARPQVFCLPDGALIPLATAPVPGPENYGFRAAKRGLCSLRLEDAAINITIASFR